MGNQRSILSSSGNTITAKSPKARSHGETALFYAHQKDQKAARQTATRQFLTASNGSVPNLDAEEADLGDLGQLGLDPQTLKSVLLQMGVQFASSDSAVPEAIHGVNSESVVKIFTASQEPDWTLPYQNLDMSDSRGSGVLISGGRVLTAAHVIAQYTFVEIQKATDPRKIPARVVNVCHDADLALLEPVGHPDFFKSLLEIKVGEMPKRGDRIFVCGYPIGGEELSITQGVVSRIELQPYSHSLRNLLAVTVDAAINSGNSGGPVFNAKGDLAGIAFQALEGAENVGYIVPPPVIAHFLTGVKQDGTQYQGFPELGVIVQTLENPMLRKHLKLKDNQSGVLLTKVYYNNSGYGTLKEGDVMTNIDGYDVANNGTITFDGQLRGVFQLAIHKHYVGELVPITVVRDGAVMKVEVTLTPVREMAPLSQYIRHPPYFTYAGLLFQPLSTDLLRQYFTGGLMMQAPQELLFLVTSAPTKKRSQVVILTRIFRDEINLGYEDLTFDVINTVNGKELRDLKDFVERIEAVNGTDVIELITSQGNKLVLPNSTTAEFKEAQKRVLDTYGIPADRHITTAEADEAAAAAASAERASKHKHHHKKAGDKAEDKKADGGATATAAQ